MNGTNDRLYSLLPVVYRQRDAEKGYPLQQLLGVIAEQVDIVQNDISRLYENWFIETCEDWAVPYIGDLIGFRPAQPLTQGEEVSASLNRILAPRGEVANSIGFRRRKGTLALLEQLAMAVAGWPARVVECGRQVSVSESINHLHLKRGRSIDVHSPEELEQFGTPFDRSSRTLEVRGINSPYVPGRYAFPDVAVFVWRLQVYSVTRSPALCFEEAGNHCYTFSILGNDVPLFNSAQSNPEPTDIAQESDLPTAIRRRTFLPRRPSDPYYGEGKSLAIWAGNWDGGNPAQPVPAEKLISADLSEWKYRPRAGQIAVDPELGRIAFPPDQLPVDDVIVSYHYGSSAGIGGGEYDRAVLTPPESRVYRVGPESDYSTLRQACERWLRDSPARAVIEITDSGVYEEEVAFKLRENQSLELRAAHGARPVIYLVQWQVSKPDALKVSGAAGSRFTLDGILVAGRGVEVRGELAELTIRHSTLVPGWGVDNDSAPRRPNEPSLLLVDTAADVSIGHSILGPIRIQRKDLFQDPLAMHISGSIVDAIGPDLPALSAPGRPVAPVVLTLNKCTIFGEIRTHSIELGENCIFAGRMLVARRQKGCLRFCYVSSASQTPRRYHCQPDAVEEAVRKRTAKEHLSEEDMKALLRAERLRVEPDFLGIRYGTPHYARLSDNCALEIRAGAEDRSELGVFHDLYQVQRATNLQLRLEEYTPAGMEAGVIFAT